MPAAADGIRAFPSKPAVRLPVRGAPNLMGQVLIGQVLMDQVLMDQVLMDQVLLDQVLDLIQTGTSSGHDNATLTET
jgi:hypothetical protein